MTTHEPVRDPILGRPHRKLRISVTDRCAFRCVYCVPEEAVAMLPREAILSFEEIERFVREAAVPLGLTQLRLTGGEPLQRRRLPELIRRLRHIEGVESIGLTTNGARLAHKVGALRDAGLTSINVSLDTLKPERFLALTRVDRLTEVLEGLRAAVGAGIPVKLNCVPIRGVNEDELGDLVLFALREGIELRFIEFMPFGSHWQGGDAITTPEIVAAVQARVGEVTPEPHRPGDTARAYRVDQGGHFGIIPTLSEPFCAHCNRVRLTADGRLLACLFGTRGADVAALLRAGAPSDTLKAAVLEALGHKGEGYLTTLVRGGDLEEGRAARNMRGLGG